MQSLHWKASGPKIPPRTFLLWSNFVSELNLVLSSKLSGSIIFVSRVIGPGDVAAAAAADSLLCRTRKVCHSGDPWVCFSFLPPMKKNIRCYRIHPRLRWRCLRRKQTGTFPEQEQRQNSQKETRAWRCRGNQASRLYSRFHFSNTVETSANLRCSRLSMWSLNTSEGK